MSAQKQRSIADFFGEERSRLVSYVRNLIRDSAARDGEDIVQDVMLTIFDRADITAPIENLAAYVYRSLRNRVVDAYRRKRDTVSLDSAGPEGDTAFLEMLADLRYDVHSEVEKHILREKIFEAVDGLKDQLRDVFTATEFEGRTYRELSEEWSVPVNTLLSRKYRAVRLIRAALEYLND